MARLVRYLVVCAWLWPMTLVYAAPPRVLVVQAEEGGAYAEAVAVLKQEVQGEITVVTTPGLTEVRPPLPALVVTVGTAAFERTLLWLEAQPADWRHVPVIATLLPRAAYEARLAQAPTGTRPISAVVLDQPLGRQLALIKRALPSHGRIGVLFGPQTRTLQPVFEKEARARDLRSVTGPIVGDPAEIYPALREVLTGADILLALPDPVIYHGGSLQNILLTAYRARVPVVAFSAAYVRAGALLAMYVTPAQAARQTTEMTRQWFAGRGLPPVQTPREFTVVANPRVAASLGLRLDEAEAIADDLRRLESRP